MMSQAANKSLQEICSLRIFEFKVVRFIPSFPAAVAMTPLASRRAPRMSSFSEASRVWTFALGKTDAAFVKSEIETLRTAPWERIRARSITFSSSRTLPGQCQRQRARIVSVGTLSIRLPIRFACFFAKKWTSKGISVARSRSGGIWMGKILSR